MVRKIKHLDYNNYLLNFFLKILRNKMLKNKRVNLKYVYQPVENNKEKLNDIFLGKANLVREFILN